ncbi:MAG: LLM class flavin-dependent oxidoreductase [Candidatus Tectomicrobia bacterium]|uniref:LLM class flavin-dependent oxidoreductase n=1 Tax=Tectimicrobiota bacterium TaxID=2528274 RepID=A0A932M095_UNCTE|nr:LLM class flavin-dependent oxidoreductase [Candidatus Tectomicrobia bacterium]
MVEFGFAVPASIHEIPVSVRVEVAEQVETLGYESFWMPHSVARDVAAFDTLDTLCAAAAKTKKIKLGTNVLQVPLYQPIDLARRVVTLDHLSRGRFLFGVGTGWIPKAFDHMGLSFPERGKRMDEALEIMTRLWTEEDVTYEGKYYRLHEAIVVPKPLHKPYPPILMGGLYTNIQRGAPGVNRKAGWNHRGIRRAARFANGWIPGGRPDLDACREGMALIKEAASQEGRSLNDEDFDLTVTSYTQFNIDKDPDKALREAYSFYNTRVRESFFQVQGNPALEALRASGCYGPAEEVAKVINRWLGFKKTVPALKRIVIMFASLDPVQQLERFHKEVRPLLDM